MLLLGVVPAGGGAFLGWLVELPVQPGQNCRHRHDNLEGLGSAVEACSPL